MRALSLLLLFLCAPVCRCTLGAQPITITGHLLGHDGRPLARASAYLFRPRSMTPIASATADADGTFRLSADAPGFFTATFTGANHREHSVVLVIDRARTVRLDVRLGRGARILQFDGAGREVPTIGNDASTDSSAGALAGARSGAKRELPDSVAVVVYFDPEVGRLADVIACIREQEPTRERARDSVRRVGGSVERFAYDWAPELRRLERAIAAERDSLVRGALMLAYLHLDPLGAVGLKSAIARRALAEIAPTSPLWGLCTSALGAAVVTSGTPARYEDYRWALITKHPDTTVRIDALYDALRRIGRTADGPLLRRYYAELVGRYMRPEGQDTAALTDTTGAARAVERPMVPAFSLRLLDDSSATVTDGSMRGTIYLIDFWATWCGPCRRELAHLHAAYAAYHERNFEIISISIDNDPATVRAFRRDEWRMPWKHAVAIAAEHDSLSARFGVTGVPTPILVDAEGRILAREGLLGRALERTPARYLAPPDATGPAIRRTDR